MRWFWGLILLATVAVAALLMRGISKGPAADRTAVEEPMPVVATGESKPSPARAEPVTKPDDRVTAEPKPVASGPDSASAASGEPTLDADADETKRPDDIAPIAVSAEPIKTPATNEPPIPPSSEKAPKPATPSETLENALDKALGLSPLPPLPPALPAPATEPARASQPESAAAVAAAEASAGAVIGPPVPKAAAPAKLVEQPDGSVLVDDLYVVRGTGTEADPFQVSWEMLVSAQDTYQPRLGQKQIPERLKLISGKWVRISGFIAFPIIAQSKDEMLMMLNQWDGCCIGVPPTPYDAIEVKLKKAVVGEDRLKVSGTVKGILRVDPYLIKDWLVSLYLMDDAQLIVDANSGVRTAGAHKGGLNGLGGTSDDEANPDAAPPQ